MFNFSSLIKQEFADLLRYIAK